MIDVGLHEHLTARLEAFGRDQIIERASRACDLYVALIRREGALSLDQRRLTAGDLPLAGPSGREFLNLVGESAGLVLMLFSVDGAIAVSSGFVDELSTIALPRDLAIACIARGESFSGTVDIGERSMLLHAKPIIVGNEPGAVIAAGTVRSGSSHPMQGLSSIESDILALAEQIQTERQRAVSDFLKIIRSIAKRIHLLALNASILSAQAGEHGRGFAVVAREIGDLAERTRQSTQELENDFLGNTTGMHDAERRQGGRRTA